MKSSVLYRISPSFLKSFDALFGRFAARILPRPEKRPHLTTVDSILIIRPGGIGDAALLAPLVTVMHTRFPSASITILAEKRNAGVFSLIPGITSLFLYDKPADLLTVLRGNYDLVIDTEQWHRLSAVVTRFIGAAMSIGFATNERGRLFTDTIPYSHSRYEAQSFLDLLAPLGIESVFNPGKHFLEIPVSAADELVNIPDYRPETRSVTLFPGASICERLWGTDKFRQLAALFCNDGLLPVVVGGPSERIAGDEIASAGGINFAGRTTLAGSACLISRSSLLVSGDSGILHIGVGLGIPTVSLFGPGIADKWGPDDSNNTILNKRLSCSPCTKFGTTPPCSNHVQCMSRISVDEVYQAATALLNKTNFNDSIRHPNVG